MQPLGVSTGRMGCSKSKTVATVSPEAAAQASSHTPSFGPEAEDRENQTVTPKDIKKKKNRIKSSRAPLPPINHTDLLPDIELFSSYQSESIDPALNNAKPRLNCPGIGRAIILAPIVPGVEKQSIGTIDSKGNPPSGHNQSFRNSVNLPAGDNLTTETNSGRASLSNSDLGFFQSHQPPFSVSPRNSISRTTMKTGLTPDSSGIFSNYGGSEFSPLNTSRSSFLPASRASSACTGSVLTTSALNTSFMTSVDGDEDLTAENTLEACQLDITDAGSEADAGSRPASATPMLRLSGDPPLNLPPDVGGIGTIVEEYEGGFTPRGPSKDVSLVELKPTPDDKLPHFTPKEIYEHNDRKGSIDWCIYLGKVYDVTRLKNTFEPVLQQLQKEKVPSNQKKSSHEHFEESFSESEESDVESNNVSVDWNYRSVYNIIWAGLDKATLKEFLNGCCVGLVVQSDETRYWEDIRSDVRKILDDLIRADARDTISAYTAEYMHLLQRWVSKYRQASPKPPVLYTDRDMNQEKYPLPEEIARNPDVLREWVNEWVKFDLDLPEHGTAWDPAESETEEHAVDDDPHHVFLSILRPYLSELPGLDHTITGQAAWSIIPENIFADDIMTDEQLSTEISRRHRKDLFNPQSMERRRSRLMNYFLNKYDMDTTRIAHFLNWADTMKKGEEQFLLLCR